MGLDPALMSNPFMAGIIDIFGILVGSTYRTFWAIFPHGPGVGRLVRGTGLGLSDLIQPVRFQAPAVRFTAKHSFIYGKGVDVEGTLRDRAEAIKKRILQLRDSL